MTFRIIHRDGEILNPIFIQFVVALTTTLMVIRFVLDALRHRLIGSAMKKTLIFMDGATKAMVLYSLGVMQRPSNKDYYYKVWAVLLVTLRYSVKIGRPAGIAVKQTPLVDLMSSFWAANILRSKAPKILKITGWLLWSVNSLRIIHGFVSWEFANDSHRENLRLLTEYMRHEHEAGDADPKKMKGYRYLVQGEAKKQNMKKENGGQARDGDMVEETENMWSLLQALRDKDKEVLTLEKIWEEPDDDLDDELKDLCLSFALYKLLRRRFFNFGIHEAKLNKTRLLVLDGILGDRDKRSNSERSTRKKRKNSERAFRVSEAEVSFLNDFFNSRHAIVFAKGFPFIRLLLSTILIVGIGGMAFAIYSFSKVGTEDELGNVHDGVVFTWFLLSFLFVKETWEIMTYVFSDWTKIILLCQYVQKPWWLRNSVTKALVRNLCKLSVPWLPRWHGKVGQCNILFPIRFAFPLRFFFGARYSRYFVYLSTDVKGTVMNCLRDCLAKCPVRLDNYLERAFVHVKAVGFPASVRGAVTGVEDCVHILLVWHIATCYCEIHLAKRGKVKATPNLGGSPYMVARTLSQYCAYVLTLVPPLVPGNSLMGRSVLIKMYEEKCRLLLGPYNSSTHCTLRDHILVRLEEYASGDIHLYDEEKDNTILKKGAALGKKLIQAIRGDDDTLEDHHIEDLWRFLSEFWAGFVIHLAASTRASHHKIYLSSGGEFMTHLWALLTHAGILGEVQHGDQNIDNALTQGDDYDRTVQY
ncbi:hypothetical protein CFC21_004130 [Triticum aestivum]|uniref:DUF4220 domain-containing protein n=1 Tax=Triticum aestivum TaxID=4565 RepID=A0A3B5Y688_WHEAT|nr:hypothetical protein CFC21_004130 [Triticum aestivum]